MKLRHSFSPCVCWVGLVNKRERFELRALSCFLGGSSFAVVWFGCGVVISLLRRSWIWR